jgi:hypothetical protein
MQRCNRNGMFAVQPSGGSGSIAVPTSCGRSCIEVRGMLGGMFVLLTLRKLALAPALCLSSNIFRRSMKGMPVRPYPLPPGSL